MERDERGFFRCPFNCGSPGYPPPKWKTEKGFAKHLIECRNNPARVDPGVAPKWKPAPPPIKERRVELECPECSMSIFTGESIRRRPGLEPICHACASKPGRVPFDGEYWDSAGLELEGDVS